MQGEVVTLKVDDALDLADDIMRLGRIRHMPVVVNNRLAGILSQRDLFRAAISSVLEFEPGPQREWLSKIEVRHVMTRHVETARETTPLRHAVATMLEKRIGCLPVVGGAAGDEIVGLVSETDCLRFLGQRLANASSAVA